MYQPSNAEAPCGKEAAHNHQEVCTPKTFVQTPLVKSERQIRLLELLLSCKDERFDMKQTVFNLDNAPPNSATSYTWGSINSQKLVHINRAPHYIRHNSCYALWQVHKHYPGRFVWIDSICINQDDKIEKGQQVQMMGAIYPNTSLMLACVGSHQDDSAF